MSETELSIHSMLTLQITVKMEEKIVPLQMVDVLITFCIACQKNNDGSSKNDGLENDLAREFNRKNYAEIHEDDEF